MVFREISVFVALVSQRALDCDREDTFNRKRRKAGRSERAAAGMDMQVDGLHHGRQVGGGPGAAAQGSLDERGIRRPSLPLQPLSPRRDHLNGPHQNGGWQMAARKPRATKIGENRPITILIRGAAQSPIWPASRLSPIARCRNE